MEQIQISESRGPDGPVFGEADHPWLPMYVDVLKQYDTSKYGFGALVIDEKYATLAASRSRIQQIFEERYMYRRISAETLPRWQTRLQLRMDELCARYDRGLAMYAKVASDSDVTGRTVSERTAVTTPDTVTETVYGSKTEAKGNGGTTADSTTFGHTTTDSGTDTVTGRTIDTPQSQISANPEYADSLQEDKTTHGLQVAEGGVDTQTHTDNRDETTEHSGSDQVKRSGKDTVSEQMTVDVTPDGGLIISTRTAWEAWDDLCVRFVAEFENLFLNVFDY